jgi:glyoxylase-like metal-dependent hydrolase (beta-lactamase superfamily II)
MGPIAKTSKLAYCHPIFGSATILYHIMSIRLDSCEVAPGIHCVTCPTGNRRIQFYALADGEHAVLFDAGLPGYVSGWLKTFKVRPQVKAVVISHADVDHFGGATDLGSCNSKVSVMAHEADRKWIESPASILEERYNCARKRFHVGYSDTALGRLRSSCGDGVPIDIKLQDGDNVITGENSWKVLHLPGHSPGHIGLWNEAGHILLLGDAALGLGIPGISGKLSMPPTHQWIHDYLASLDRLSRLDVEIALTGHWPLLKRADFAQLIQESRDCVVRDLELLMRLLKTRALSFIQLQRALNDKFRAWPKSEDIHYFYALAGYLEFLEHLGEIQIEEKVIRAA